jgi:hypothetical protein
MNALHVVTKVPVAWEAISWSSALATLISAEERLVTMSMHSVGFTLMTKKAGSRREMKILAGSYLTPVWLQMRIHKFAGGISVVGEDRDVELTRNCTLVSRVCVRR